MRSFNHLLSNLAAICDGVLDAVFPPRCAGCRTFDKELFCPACQTSLRPIRAPLCRLCGWPFDALAQAAAECAACRANRYHGAPPFRALRSVYTFHGPIRDAVHGFKYKGKTALAAPLARVLHQWLEAQPKDAPAIPIETLALVTPVPLHAWRRFRRGYNQSELLARHLGALLDIPGSEILCRTRHTTPQVGLRAGQRALNVRGAFSVNEDALDKVNPRRGPVLVVDDVCTTGATLRECAAVLRRAGVKDVYVLTLARQMPRH